MLNVQIPEQGKSKSTNVTLTSDTVLDELTEGFYFGVGGMGDALFLLSSFYDKHPGSSLLFWSASPNWRVLQSFLNQFPGLGKVIVIPRPSGGSSILENYHRIIEHSNFRGKAQLADRLDYMREWGLRGKDYRKEIPQTWDTLRQLWPAREEQKAARFIGLGPWGSTENVRGKNRRLSLTEFYRLVQVTGERTQQPLRIFGSLGDKREFPLPLITTTLVEDCRGYSWKEVFTCMNECVQFITVDTWFMHWVRFANIPTTVIRTRYAADPKKIFGGLPYDPSDKVFLEDWGFNIRELSELV